MLDTAEYETFVGCDTSAFATPSHACELGDIPGAFFESDEETEYDVCIEFPSGFFDCAEEQEAEAGSLYVNPLFPDELGDYLVSWYVGVEEIGSWTFRIDPPPAPPAPPAPAPLPAPAPVILPAIVSPTPACLKAKKRVSQLGSQLRNANGQKGKLKIRARLKAAKAAKKRVC